MGLLGRDSRRDWRGSVGHSIGDGSELVAVALSGSAQDSRRTVGTQPGGGVLVSHKRSQRIRRGPCPFQNGCTAAERRSHGKR